MSVLLGLVVAVPLGVVSGLGWQFVQGNAGTWVGLVVFFSLLLLVITPFRMWKEKARLVEEMTASRVTLALDRPQRGSDGSTWYRVMVRAGETNIQGASARWVLFEWGSLGTPPTIGGIQIDMGPQRYPNSGDRLPFARHTTPGGTHYSMDIPKGETVYVDFATSRQGDQWLCIPTPPRTEGQPLLNDYQLPPKTYPCKIRIAYEHPLGRSEEIGFSMVWKGSAMDYEDIVNTSGN